MADIITIEDIDREIERVIESQRERAERIFNCEVEDTDCFLSMRASDKHIDVLETQRRIIQDGGTAWFTEYATLDGELVNAEWCNTKYGTKLRAEMPDGSVVWTTARTERGLAKKGLKEVRVRRTAWADFGGGWYSWANVHPAYLNRATGEYSEDNLIEVEW